MTFRWRLLVFTLFLLFHNPVQLKEQVTHEQVPHFILGVLLPPISNELNLSDVKVSLEYWVKELSAQFNVLDAHAKFFDDVSGLHDAVERKEIDMAIAPPLDFVEKFDRRRLKGGVVGVLDNENPNALCLLVHKHKVNDLKDLKGKKLLLPLNDRLSKIFIDTLTLRHSNQSAEFFFSSVRFKKKSNRLILDLFFGDTDAVVVYRSYFDVMVELNPQIAQKIIILENYPLKSTNFAFFRHDYPYAELIFPKIDTFSRLPRGKQMLEIFKSDKLVRSKVKDLEPVEELLKEYKRLEK
jgi:ABC-type phosphate/phosphonate transport system substrate-binding protein